MDVSELRTICVREELARDNDTGGLFWKEGGGLSILERKSFGGESFEWVALWVIFEAIKELGSIY
jgi:hypothetical protein